MKQVPVAQATIFDADRALKQWLGDPDWMFKTGLGGMLTAGCFLISLLDLSHLYFVPVALAVASVLCGYLLRVARQRISDPESKKMADWNDWPDLFMSGVTWIAVQFCFCVCMAAFLFSTFILSFYALIAPQNNTMIVVECAVVASLLTLFWASFLTSYLWLNFAIEERVTGALALRKVVMRIRKNPLLFLIAWALSSALQLGAIVIPAVTLIGVFLIPSTFFAAQLVGTNLLAEAWRSVPDEQVKD